MNQFAEARKVLEDLRRAEEAVEKAKQRKCDWDDPEDVAAYRGAERVLERQKLLKKLAPKNVCPSCRRQLASHRSFVIDRNESSAMCRSCYSSFFSDGEEPFERMKLISDGNLRRFDQNIFPEVEFRYHINGFRLSQARELTGHTSNTFAKLCGWSSSYQRHLERGGSKTISLDTAETILEALAELKVETPDLL